MIILADLQVCITCEHCITDIIDHPILSKSIKCNRLGVYKIPTRIPERRMIHDDCPKSLEHLVMTPPYLD